MSDSIMCVRIAQRALRPAGESTYSRFPFDRVYLGKKHLAPQLKKLFRYYLMMELDAPLLDALNQLRVTSTKVTQVYRDNLQRKAVVPVAPHQAFIERIQDHSEWLLVVPTHVRTVYRKPNEFKEPEKSELAYVLSRAVTVYHNSKVRLPQITLVTPTRTIPILCGVCRHSLDLHAGKCLPGQGSCKTKVRVRLPLDTHNSGTSQQSADESGD